LEKLKDERFYLYEVSSGYDYDADDDGVIDESPTPNEGVFHLLVLGSHLKVMKQANVTVISELVYQKLLSSLRLKKSEILLKMKTTAREIIEKDINGDGFVGIEDILRYNPILDKNRLYKEYQDKIMKIIDDILKNRSFDLVPPLFLTKSQIEINENLSLVTKLEVKDASPITINLLGEDSSQFIYNTTTQELSLLQKVDFENPHDKNRDNIFEITIEAIDKYFNRTEQMFFIKIMDINETIPQVPILRDTNLSLYENNIIESLIGTVMVQNQGTSEISNFTILGDEREYFRVDSHGKIFAQATFDYELKNSYTFQVEAENDVGKSNKITVTVNIKDIPDIKATVQDVFLTLSENIMIGTLIGHVNITNEGDSDISSIELSGYNSNSFTINKNGNIFVNGSLDYESYHSYYLQYKAINQAGESNSANLTIRISNVYENSGSDYPPTESGIQKALDNGDYDFVLNQLINNRDAYSGLDEDTVNMNIAGAYVGKSGYTLFDITGAMSDGNPSSFNDFVYNITKENDAVESINRLAQADSYYRNIVQEVDCTLSTGLTVVQQDACFNLGLVRLTSLTNAVKLLFGGDSQTVQKWSNGVEINSTDDLNGNGVLDDAEASACAIVYANNPNDNCQSGTFYSYRGGVTFNRNGTEEKLTLIEVDVGNQTNGYHNFYQLISSNPNNNTPILTSGICDKNFNITTETSDGINYFPCPVFDSSGEIMGIKQSLESVANIQSLFSDGETKTTTQNYITNITGDANGTIGLDNLSTYLRTH